MSIFENTNHSAAEIEALLKHRSKMAVLGAAAALSINGGTETQLSMLEAISGKRNPVGAALASNLMLGQYGFERTLAYMKRVLAVDPKFEGELRIFDVPPSSGGDKHWDFREGKRVIQPSLKGSFSNGFVRFRLLSHERQPKMVAMCLGWNSPMHGAALKRAATGSRRPARKSVEHTYRCGGIRSVEEVAGALARLFDLSTHEDLGPFFPHSGIDEPRVKNRHHQLDLMCQVISARILLGRDMFGFGDGKRLLDSLRREIAARAASLDLTRTSPLQPEGVEAALATFPADKNEGKCALPSIKLL